jgi:site-specific DNA-methyltransferase (adenine-specific)
MQKDSFKQNITLYQGDCLDIMKIIPDKSIDAVIADPPYKKTACSWDQAVIPPNEMWAEVKRIIKPDGNIVLTSAQPFTTLLIYSNLDWYRYELIWEKTQGTAPMLAEKRPLPAHENIEVFYQKLGTYNPQMEYGNPYKGFNSDESTIGEVYGNLKSVHKENIGVRYPKSVQTFKRQTEGLHPTQKPLDLFEYLIKTYTNKNDVVLDFCFGSCTTGIACLNTRRQFIGIEKDKRYYNIGKERIQKILRNLQVTLDDFED